MRFQDLSGQMTQLPLKMALTTCY